MAAGAGKVLGARTLDAGGRDRTRARARQICRGRGDRWPVGVQRRRQPGAGGTGPAHFGGPEGAPRADGLGPPRWRLDHCSRRRARTRRHYQIVARRRRSSRCATNRGKRSPRPVHAHRRIRADRHRGRAGDLRQRFGSARRGCSRGHCDRRSHKIRSHCGVGQHRPCHQFTAGRRDARCAQPRRFRRLRHRRAGALRGDPAPAASGYCTAGADRGAWLDPGRFAGHVHTGGCDWRDGAGESGRAADSTRRRR